MNSEYFQTLPLSSTIQWCRLSVTHGWLIMHALGSRLGNSLELHKLRGVHCQIDMTQTVSSLRWKKPFNISGTQTPPTYISKVHHVTFGQKCPWNFSKSANIHVISGTWYCIVLHSVMVGFTNNYLSEILENILNLPESLLSWLLGNDN
jgi:hypothetical protein